MTPTTTANIDAVQEMFYDPNGNLIRRENDSNNDGNVDQVTEFFYECSGSPIVEVPTIDSIGLGLLVALFATAGTFMLSRRSRQDDG